MSVFIVPTGSDIDKLYDLNDPMGIGSSGPDVLTALDHWATIDAQCDQETLPEYIDVYELVLKERKVRV